MLALACTTGAENSCQDFVYLGSEVLDELAGQKILPLHTLIARMAKLAPKEALSAALTSLAKRLEDGAAVAPKSETLDAVLDARDLLVKHNGQVASDDELRSLNSQLEFYQKAIENDMLTVDAPQAKNSDCCNLANGECAAPAEKKMATRYTSSANVALYVTGSAGNMAITLGDLATTDSVDLISKSGTGTTTVDGGTVNVGTTTATTVYMGKSDGTTAVNINGGNELRFINPSTTSNYVGFKGGAASTQTIWTLPLADGAAGDVLSTLGTSGSHQLNWVTAPVPTNVWLTSGNSPTGTPYLGTLNTQPLNFVANNSTRMSISTAGVVSVVGGRIDADGDTYIHKTGIGNFFAGAGAGVLSGVSAYYNTVVGYQAGSSLASGGSSNILIGYQAGSNITRGFRNTIIGYQAGSRTDTGTSNVYIGFNAGTNCGDNSYNICIGNAGQSGDSGVIRLGTNGTQTACYIAGIYDPTANERAVYVNSSGQLGTLASSIRYKENVNPLPSEDRFMELNPVTFNYKSDAKKTRQFGLIAEEVEKIYPELVSFNNNGQVETVQYHELDGIFVKEIQENRTRITTLQTKTSAYQDQIATLRAEASIYRDQIATLQQIIATMQAQIATLEAKMA